MPTPYERLILEQRIDLFGDEIRKSLLIINKSETLSTPKIPYEVKLFPGFTRQFNEGEEIDLFFRDTTLGIRSEWRLKGSEPILGVKARVSYRADQKMPVVLTLGNTYDKKVAKEFMTYVTKASKDASGAYSLNLVKELPLQDFIAQEKAAISI